MESQPSLFTEEDFLPPQPPRSVEAVQPLQSPILFGWDPTDRIVAAEACGVSLILWRRLPDDTLERIERTVLPWILVTSPQDIPSPSSATVTRLEGEGFAYLAEFQRPEDCGRARMDLRERHAEYIAYASDARMALTRTGMTLFKGMSMDDVRRMQVDIETTGLDPQQPDNRILLIAAADNRGLVTTLTGKEDELLHQFVALVRERDPDVIEGHNIHGFDLPFIAERCRRHGIVPAIGRDAASPGSAMLFAGIRRTFSIGGITRPLTPWRVFGRHVVDTFLAVQRFDWARGSLTGYGLKEVARAFGIAEEDRVELPRDRMEATFRTDPELVAHYATQDVLETGRLAELVLATEFYQTQMVPDSYGACAISGAGEKINALFIRAYLHAGRAIPRPLPTAQYEGGYTELRRSGVLHRVVKADVESLYPSIMLTEGIRPRTDTLGIFLPALKELTTRRLDAKARAKTANGAEANYWDGLQSSFKVLINSFYGYLGAGGFNFNDPEAAARVTARGREIVKQISDNIEATGGQVIEIDTDGVYFVPPEDIQGEEAEREYISRIGASLPEGIRLAFDGRFRSMVSVKTKNYVLCGYDGKRTYKGASLRSRADEPYGREFIARAVDLLMEGRPKEIRELYAETAKALREHRIPIEQLARRERVTEKTFSSAAKQRSARVAEGVAVGDFVRVYERANGSLGLVEEYTPGDENVPYYVDKLYKFACRLREAIGDTFPEIVPKPGPGGMVETACLDLFGD
jgi:DNA polymerase elongation subunit (family B)